MNVFHLLGERRFLKKSLYYSLLVGSIGGQSRILGSIFACLILSFRLILTDKKSL